VGDTEDPTHARAVPGHQSFAKNATSITTYMYRNIFGTISTRIMSQSINHSEKKFLSHRGFYIKNETTWTFIPSFLSLCIEVQYTDTCGSIQRSFRTYPLIRDDHPIWYMGWMQPPSTPDFQALLTSGTVSPFSVNSTGSTLLHVSYYFHKRTLMAN
jgi:hypothetical protein